MTSYTYPLLLDRLRAFASARDWSGFHTPRNLALAVAGEVGELCAEFRWTGDAEVDKKLSDPKFVEAIASEAADVLTFLLYFADSCGIDLIAAAHNKLRLNEERYPAELVFGSAEKYDTLPDVS